MPRQRVSRPMTFTGCWTCKSRKIRCDERPVSCGNCEKRGIECGGYDIRLQWISDPFAEPSLSKGKGRRSIKLDKGGGDRYKIDEIDDFLDTIDNSTETGIPLRQGPFSTFPAHIDSLPQTTTSEVPLEAEETISRSPSRLPNELQVDMRFGRGKDDASPTLDLGTRPTPLHSDGYWSLVLDDDYPIREGEDNSMKELADSDISSDLALSSGDEVALTSRNSTPYSPYRSHRSSTASSRAFTIDFPLIKNLTTSLSGNNEVDSLIHHYGAHMADLLQPISHAQNIYRQLYLSTALEGSMTPVPHSNAPRDLAHTALYHSILSSSAYHIWYGNKNQTKYQMIGSRNRQQAIYYLQSAVNSITSNADYKLFMVVILSLITIGVMSGECDDFLVHIRGATQLRKSRSQWRIVSRSTKQLNDISAFLALLARTTTFQSSPPPWLGPSQVALQADEGLMQSNNCYEYIYGITPTIATAIQETCILAEILYQFENQPLHSIPDDLRETCEALGDRLLSWTLESETIVSIPQNDDLMLEIFSSHAKAWHYGALIYYYRRIQRCELGSLAKETQYVADYMHAVEDVKMRLSPDMEDILAPITWPCFVASCEALGSGRETWRRWWHRTEHYNIANLRKQWEIVQLIWDETDRIQQSGICKEDWIDLYIRLGCHVLPV